MAKAAIKRSRVATVHVELTQYGRASFLVNNAAAHADLCEHPTSEWTANFNGHGRCNSLAKFVLEGMKVCGKHASFILLRAAYKAGMTK